MSDAAFRQVLSLMASDSGFAARVRTDAAALAAFDLNDQQRQRLRTLAPEAHVAGVTELRERLSKSALFMPMGAEAHGDAAATEHGSLAGHMGTHQAADSGLDAFVEGQAAFGDDDAH